MPYPDRICSGKLSPMSNRREFFKEMAGATAGAGLLKVTS
jgi:hypothetical protein